MENLRWNEKQLPDINKKWLLIESQNKELNKLVSNMESDEVSVFDIENILN